MFPKTPGLAQCPTIGKNPTDPELLPEEQGVEVFHNRHPNFWDLPQRDEPPKHLALKT